MDWLCLIHVKSPNAAKEDYNYNYNTIDIKEDYASILGRILLS